MNDVTTYKERIRDFYDVLSPHFRDWWGEHLHDGFYVTGRETKAEAQDQLVAELARRADLPVGVRGLDVGCGMGATSIWLARELGASMTGVTLSSVQVGLANELARREGVDASFRVADADTLETIEPYDFLWMVGVLGHLDDQRAFIDRSPRLLADGGRFVLGDWVATGELTDRDRRRYVDPVLEGMLMPTIATRSDYEEWFRANGYRVLVSEDITDPTRKTWDEGVGIAQVPGLIKIARGLGRDALGLLKAIHGMRKAMDRGHIGYGVVVAEKEGGGT